ncbi:uncharacterized protein LOC127605077 [Hippocampus zosterae]|uniref:uncharacterized protein LOC127605077 n=1 Tax=Hippocampus zosterae TaxID=109293 RepID=UPI00223D5C74|nr:uncharacterized protein LOC127605077 [Hippocampus zosterae]
MFPSTRKVALNRTKLKDTTCPNMMPPPRLKTQQKLSEVGRDRTFDKMEPSTGPQQAEETARRTPALCDNVGRSSDKNMNPIPTSPAGSEASLKRTVQSSGCELCDNCKIISPRRRRRTLVRQVAQKLSPCSEQHKSIPTSKKVPDLTVNLCDVVRMSGARCYNCGFVLPHGLENKPVYCFKEDIAASGLRLRSSCSGHQKDGSDEHQSVDSGPGTSCNTVGTGLFDDDPRSSTCQRVRLYVWKRKSSCARTYITWHDKQLLVSGFMNLETRTSDFAQTEEIPPVSLTPREPSPSFDTGGDAGDGVVEEMDEKVTEVRGNAEQLDCSPPISSSDHDDDESFNGEGRSPSSSDQGSPSTELAECCPSESGTGGGAHLGVLDEFTAYQRDILLIDVDHDDSELFDILPQESPLKLGSNIVHKNPKTLTAYGASQTFKQRGEPEQALAA